MKRVLTALILVPFGIYSVLFAPWPLFAALTALVALLCFYEYAGMTRCFAPLGYVAGLLVLLAPVQAMFPLLVLTALAAMCVPLALSDLGQSVPRAAALALGLVYIFGSWKTALLIRSISPHWLMFALMVNWIGDTGAYYVGRRFGRHKLAPAVSPGKSWEGAIASVVAAIIFGVIYLPLAVKGLPVGMAALMSLLGNAAGQVGDLAESAIKRQSGVKDSGTMLPGHGGMLDRMDSSLFTMPVIYALLFIL